MTQFTVPTSLTVGQTLVYAGFNTFVAGPISAPRRVEASVAELGAGQFVGEVACIVIGTWPNVLLHELVWLSPGVWAGLREVPICRQNDKWAMDLGGRDRALWRNAWCLPYDAIPYGKSNSYLFSDFVAGTDTTITLSNAGEFATSGYVYVEGLSARVFYTGKSGSQLTGVTTSASPGTYLAGSAVYQETLGGWGTIVTPLDHAAATVAAGLSYQLRMTAFLNGSWDAHSMSLGAYMREANYGDTVGFAPLQPADGLGFAATITGPIDDFVPNRAAERPFEMVGATGLWTNWAASTPTKDVVWPTIYARMNDVNAAGYGEFYNCNLTARVFAEV